MYTCTYLHTFTNAYMCICAHNTYMYIYVPSTYIHKYTSYIHIYMYIYMYMYDAPTGGHESPKSCLRRPQTAIEGNQAGPLHPACDEFHKEHMNTCVHV